MSLYSRILRAIIATIILPFWYLQRLFPRDKNLWVFGAWFGSRYSDNSKALFEYVLSNETSIQAIWMTRNEKVYALLNNKGLPVVKSNSFRGFVTALRAGVAVITNDYNDIFPQCMNGVFSVWLWHGMPMKKIGKDELKFNEEKYSLLDKIKGKFTDFLFPYYKCPHKDVVLSTGVFFDEYLHTSFVLPYDKIWNDGLPRNDYFFKKSEEDFIKSIKTKYPGSRIIVYMPTHRKTALKGQPYNGFSGYGFNEQKLYNCLQRNNLVFINKGHFYDRGSDYNQFGGRFINITDDDYENLYTLLKDIDILVTDYSSIYFDFLLTRKPILLTPFDIDDYVSNERPLYFDYHTLEAVKTKNWDELLALLDSKSLESPTLKEVSKYHDNIDGFSSKRISNHIKQILGL